MIATAALVPLDPPAAVAAAKEVKAAKALALAVKAAKALAVKAAREARAPLAVLVHPNLTTHLMKNPTTQPARRNHTTQPARRNHTTLKNPPLSNLLSLPAPLANPARAKEEAEETSQAKDQAKDVVPARAVREASPAKDQVPRAAKDQVPRAAKEARAASQARDPVDQHQAQILQVHLDLSLTTRAQMSHTTLQQV